MLIIFFTIPQTDGEEPVPLRNQLALLKQPKIAVALTVTFFWIGGYSIVYTYISPFLLTVTGLSEQGVSSGLFAFGIASLIGSKIGGYSTDRWGFPVHWSAACCFIRSRLFCSRWRLNPQLIVFPLLMLWAFSAWSSGPTQQYYLMSLAPGASGIMLSLNTSVVQLGMAAGAGLGGVVVEQASLTSISWIGATGVILAAATATASFGISHQRSRRKAAESKLVKTGA